MSEADVVMMNASLAAVAVVHAPVFEADVARMNASVSDVAVV